MFTQSLARAKDLSEALGNPVSIRITGSTWEPKY